LQAGHRCLRAADDTEETNMMTNRWKLIAGTLAALSLIGTSLPAAAQAPWKHDRGRAHHVFPKRGVAPVPANAPHGRHGRWYHGPRPGMAPMERGRPVVVFHAPRVRHHRHVVVIRSHGPVYQGYGHYRSDNDAYKWLAFTAITLKALDVLNEAQERAHEAAQVQATTAPIGQRIIWNEGGATGSVTAVREGTTTQGRYCREFQQLVTVGGHTEQAYGTACQQPDGAWEIVSTGD
jgi:hypothetical protein